MNVGMDAVGREVIGMAVALFMAYAVMYYFYIGGNK
jgi:hypothetical protein